MKNKTFWLFFVVTFGACQKLDAPEEIIIDRLGWLDAAGITKIQYLSHSGGNLYFEAEVAAMKNGDIILSYPDSSFFPVTGLPFSTSVLVDSVYQVELSANSGFQNILLVDESSEDWLFVDNGDFVSAMYRIKKLSKTSSSQYCGFGFFARDEQNGDSPVHFFRNANGSLFEHTDQEIMQFLAQNYPKLGLASGSSLYDAIDKAADVLIANPLSSDRSITVVSGNPDDGNSQISLTNLIQKCQTNGIRINMIFQSYVSYNPYKLALLTGGFISENNSTPLYSGYKYNTAKTVIYHNLELIMNTGKRYRIRGHINRASNWVSGQEIGAYFVMDYFLDIDSPYFQDDLIDDLDIHHKLPVYIKIP
jgi:hypothetical protein